MKTLILTCFTAIFLFNGCTKQKYTFGELVTPADVNLATVVVGQDVANPNGAGSGNVNITTTATKAINYKIDFGDGNVQMVPSGVVTHKYAAPGTFDYTVTVTAVGTGGVTSIASKKITVFVAFEIPAAILENLTGGSNKVWVTDRLSVGHVGVGPANAYTSEYYSAQPNERAACLYDDEITFSKDANNNVTMSIDNKGQSFLTAAATASYGTAGGDNCYDLNIAAPRKLAFMDATSGSTTANSTRIQFVVPGNGLINFGTGGNSYEIIALTPTTITLRNIGTDGLAWYQKLKVK